MLKLPSLKRVSTLAAVLGIVIPRILLVYRIGCSAPLLTRALWPTAPSLVVMEGYQQSTSSYMIVTSTIAANALVYVAAFGVLWGFAWVLIAAKRSFREGGIKGS